MTAAPPTKTSHLKKTDESLLEPAKTLDPIRPASGTPLDPVKPVPDPVNHPVKPVSGPPNPVKPISSPPNPVKPVSGPPNPVKQVPPKSVWDTDDEEDEVPDLFFDLKQPPQKKADEVKEKIRERSLFDDSDEEEDEDLFLNLKISSVTSSESQLSKEPAEVQSRGGKPVGGISMFGGLDPRAFLKKRSRYAYFSCLPNTNVQFIF